VLRLPGPALDGNGWPAACLRAIRPRS